MSDTNSEYSDVQFIRPIVVAGAVPIWADAAIWLYRGVAAITLFFWCRNGFLINNDTVIAGCLIGIPYVLFETVLGLCFLKRRWIIATKTDVIYSSFFGSETFALEEIDGCSITVKDKPSEFVLFFKARRYIYRTFRIYVNGRSKPLLLKHRSRSDKPDPLYAFILQVLVHLTNRFEQQIEAGGTVAGDNWTVSGEQFTFGTDTENAVSIPITEIAAVDYIGDKLHFYRRGESESCFAVPQHDKNVGWMASFLKGKISTDDTPIEGLGRFLFANKRPATWIFLAVFAAILTAMIAASFIPANLFKDEEITFIIFEIVAGIFLICVPLVWVSLQEKRFYTNGLTVSSPTFKKELLFDQIASFEWSQTEMYVNHSHAGTRFDFVLHLDPSLGGGVGKNCCFPITRSTAKKAKWQCFAKS